MPEHTVNGPWDQSPQGSARAVLGRINYFTQEKVAKTQGRVAALAQNHHHTFRGQKTPRAASQVQQKWLFLHLLNTQVTKPANPPKPEQSVTQRLVGAFHRSPGKAEEPRGSERRHCPKRAQKARAEQVLHADRAPALRSTFRQGFSGCTKRH